MQMFYVAHKCIHNVLCLLSQLCHIDINEVKRRLLKSLASRMFLQMGKINLVSSKDSNENKTVVRFAKI